MNEIKSNVVGMAEMRSRVQILMMEEKFTLSKNVAFSIVK